MRRENDAGVTTFRRIHFRRFNYDQRILEVMYPQRGAFTVLTSVAAYV